MLGKKDENEQWLFPAKYALDPSDIAIKLGERLIRAGAGEDIKASIAELKRLKGNQPTTAEAAVRIPYFCPGCPHNSSTVVPRARAPMPASAATTWRTGWTATPKGFTQMGGEGTNWIGEAPFSKTPHVFQNLGDGTYIHSGSLAIRAARAAGVNMTFKILYNDAVAMTGGQALDGGMTVPMIVNQVLAEGIEKVVVVTDEPHKYPLRRHPARACRSTTAASCRPCRRSCARSRASPCWSTTRPAPPRSAGAASAACSPIPTSACSSIRRCARAAATAASKSNCVAVVPLETELGTKRAIDQSACNKDFSCLNGFCPSFVTVHGAKVKKSAQVAVGDSGIASMLASLPEPKLPALDQPYTMLVTGVGGTGVVTLVGRARPGGPPGEQGLRLHRHDRARPEGRRGRLPHARRQVGATRSMPSAPAWRAPTWCSAATSS